jgi:hypothetical protein
MMHVWGVDEHKISLSKPEVKRSLKRRLRILLKCVLKKECSGVHSI